MKFLIFNFLFLTNILNTPAVYSLPTDDDLPEEVLATEITLDARSSLDNQVLSPQEYLQEKQGEEESLFPPEVDSEIQHNIFLLQILKMFRTINPL